MRQRKRRGCRWKAPCIVSCFVMFPMPCVKLCRSVPAYRSSIALRSAPFRPRRRRTLFARVSCARARARLRAFCAGAVRTPDCARETADTRVPSPPAGAFLRAPALASLSRKAERRPRKPPLSTPNHTTLFPQSSPLAGAMDGPRLPRSGKAGGRASLPQRLPIDAHAKRAGVSRRRLPVSSPACGLPDSHICVCPLRIACSPRSPRPPSRGPASGLAAASPVHPVLHRLRRHREPWTDPGSGSGVTKGRAG